MMEIEYVPLEEQKRLEGILLQNMRQHAPELRRVLEDVNSEWCNEDRIYRYYHQSFKVFDLRTATREMVDALAAIAPEGGRSAASLTKSFNKERVMNSPRRTTNIGWNGPPPSSRHSSMPGTL